MPVTTLSSPALRRFVVGLIAVLLTVVAVALPAQPSYAAGSSSGTAESIKSVPFTSKATTSKGQRLKAAAVDPDEANISTACNGGAPLYSVRWFTYKPAVTTTIVGRGEVYSITGRDRYALGSGVAILSASKALIDCNVVAGGGLDPGANQVVAVAGPTKVTAGTTVYVVQFARTDPTSGCDEFVCYDVEQNLAVRPAGAYPVSDNWYNASPITGSPFKQTVDTSLSTQDGVETALFNECSYEFYAVTRSVWWTLTPTSSGPISASVDSGYTLAYAELTPDGPVPVSGCNGETNLVKGHTYLLVAALVDAYHADQADSGGPVTLTVNSAPALGKPDLVVTKVVSSAAAPKAGDPVSFRATIKNQGTAPTQGGITHGVAFRVDGATKTWSDTFNASLAPGQSVTVTSNGGVAGAPTWPATVGSHTVTAIVDDVNRIPGEANENNNTATAPLTVAAGPARPDLVVTGVSWTPANPAAGTAVTFTATIKNQGSAATPAGIIHGAAFRVDGVTKAWSDTNKASLAAGASRTLTATGGPAGKATWPATTGPHSVTAIVDDVNRIPGEADENNNTLAVPLNVGASPSRPDVVVTGISWAPTSPAAGAPVRLTATVKNIGTRSTPNGTIVGVSFQPNGKTTAATYSDTFTGPLHPDQTITLTANGGGTGGTWKTPAGSTPLVAVVDDTNRFPETNEANNTLTTTVTTG